ncbi:MAG TPA: BON domain-containing protein [Steroidobacteraceae bacterium]|nr:BON domain-containing protein [Steroidobacteraceae bacterium]
MAVAHDAPARPLLAGTLGVAVAGLCSGVAVCAPPAQQMQREIVVTAPRPSDALLAEKVTTALQQDPYIFSDHVSVAAKNGVVRVSGVVRDLSDLFAILGLARRIAGNGRVVDEIEYIPIDDDGN